MVFKIFVLLVVLVGLIQLIRRLAVKPSDAVSDLDLGGWVSVANFLEVSSGLVRWLWLLVVWCGGDAVMVAGCM
jgi:hypothetical protein